MVSQSDLEGFRRDRYFARSWALLTRDRGWVKPVLMMTVALLVPAAGILGVLGYALEWARLTAWNVNAAPKQRGVAVGECIRSGWRAFLVTLVWGIVSGVVVGVLSSLPLLGALFAGAWVVLSFGYVAVVMAATLRATIYQRFGAGMRIQTIWQMVRHDPAGLARVAGMLLAGAAVAWVAELIVCMVTMAAVMPQLLWIVRLVSGTSLYMMSDLAAGAMALDLIASLVSALGPALVVLVLVGGFIAVVVCLLAFTAVGLWFRQFDVASWGRDEDPLPPFVDDPRDREAASGPAAPEPEPVVCEVGLPEVAGFDVDGAPENPRGESSEVPVSPEPERPTPPEPAAGAEKDEDVEKDARAEKDEDAPRDRTVADDDGTIVEEGR